jgi:hypothetical protein
MGKGGKKTGKDDQACRKSLDQNLPKCGKFVLKKACHLPLLVHKSAFGRLLGTVKRLHCGTLKR